MTPTREYPILDLTNDLYAGTLSRSIYRPEAAVAS